jgi:hypothetical protein
MGIYPLPSPQLSNRFGINMRTCTWADRTGSSSDSMAQRRLPHTSWWAIEVRSRAIVLCARANSHPWIVRISHRTVRVYLQTVCISHRTIRHRLRRTGCRLLPAILPPSLARLLPTTHDSSKSWVGSTDSWVWALFLTRRSGRFNAL